MKQARRARTARGSERLLARGAREHRLPDRGVAADRPQAAPSRVPHHRHPALRLPQQGRRPAGVLRGAAARAARARRRRAARAGVARPRRIRLRDRRTAVQHRHAEVLRGADRHGARRRADGDARRRAAGGLRDRRRLGRVRLSVQDAVSRARPTSSSTFPSCSCSRRPISAALFPRRADACSWHDAGARSTRWRDADFVFVPNTLAHLMSPLPLDLTVNMVSFQEMTDAQVRRYARLAARAGCPLLYSLNRERSPYNPELRQRQRRAGRTLRADGSRRSSAPTTRAR